MSTERAFAPEEQESAAADRAERRALGLGWLSLALGIAQIAAPRAVARLIGVKPDRRNRVLLRVIGVREILHGVGILTRPRPAGWLSTRVAGDVMDMTLLGSALRLRGTDGGKVVAALVSVAGLLLVDAGTSRELARGFAREQRVTRSVTVLCSPEDAYRLWRDPLHLPRFVEHLASVEVIDGRRSRWIMKGEEAAREVEIVDDRPGELVAWQEIGGKRSGGSVSFARAPRDRGAEVRLTVFREARGGALGKAVEKFAGALFERQVEADLRRFKQLVETGEIVQSDASLHRGPHPARPSGRAEAQVEGGAR